MLHAPKLYASAKNRCKFHHSLYLNTGREKCYPAILYVAMNKALFSLSIFLCSSTAHANTAFMAEGVNTSDLTASERFYDSGKGYYWNSNGYYSGIGWNLLMQAYNDDSFQSLGDLVSYMPENCQGKLNAGSPGLVISYADAAIAPLKQDSALCWAHTSANVLQYWQSYYGMFSKNTHKLPDGLTYGKQYLSSYAGTQSLKIGMLFYDNWKNEGGFMQFGALWYLQGKNAISEAECAKRMNTDAVDGGYFAEWFADGSPSSYQTTEGWSVSLSSIGRDFAEGMGYEQIDGKWVQTVKGQIGSLTVSISGVGDHAITCYGFELDEMNNIKSITYANSDDSSYALHTRSVSFDFNTQSFILSTDNDEDGTNGNTWTLYSYEFIRTPDSLVKLREAYDSALTWNGSEWQTNDGTAQQYSAGKSLVFDDTAAASAEGNTVKAEVRDQVTAPLMVIDNSEKDYEISTVSSGSISVSDMLLKMGSGIATVSGVDVAKLNIQSGNLILTGKADVTALTELIIADGASLSVSVNDSFSESDEATVTLGAGSLARFGIGATLNANLVLNGTELTLANGGLLLGSNLTLYGNNTLNTTLGETTVLMTGVDSLFLGDRQVFDLSAGTIDASAYFANLEEGSYSLCYHGTTLSLQQIPEPTSFATSLLASALLFSRRCRKN